MTCSPVSRKSSQASIVPKTAVPRAARSRSSGACSSSQAIFVPEKYGSRVRPVRSRISSSWPAARRRSQIPADRRSCQTIARCSGSPVAGSQTQIVSRWLVIPTAISCSGATPASSQASRATAWVTAQISALSCSTQPGCGKCWRNSR